MWQDDKGEVQVHVSALHDLPNQHQIYRHLPLQIAPASAEIFYYSPSLHPLGSSMKQLDEEGKRQLQTTLKDFSLH